MLMQWSFKNYGITKLFGNRIFGLYNLFDSLARLKIINANNTNSSSILNIAYSFPS